MRDNPRRRFWVYYVLARTGRRTEYSSRKNLVAVVGYGSQTFRFGPGKLPQITRELFLAWWSDKKTRKKRRKKEVQSWVNVGAWLNEVVAKIEREGGVWTELERIYRKDPRRDVVNRKTLFIWDKPVRLPLRVVRLGRARAFRVVRIWAIVRSKDDDSDFRLWSRSALHLEGLTWVDSQKVSRQLLQQLVQDADDLDYIQVTELVAWTAYTFRERAPAPKREGR